MSRVRRGTLAPIILGVCGVATLLILGAWQVQRLDWKEALIATLEERAAAAPVSVPVSPDSTRDNFLRVRVAGLLEPEELDVLTSIKNVGPGFRIVAPMLLEDGRRILLDLGYVPEVMKDLESRTQSPRHGGIPIELDATGILYWPVSDGLAPAPDQKREMWFEWDVAKMAATLQTEPLLVVAAQHNLGQRWPLPRPPGVDLPNNHLEYAITWFGLAVVWAFMSVFWLRSELKRVRAEM
ncbi:MAG: SURF1 family protein [Paracoccaceae bacterium]